MLLEQRLRSALLKINPDPDGTPWLDDTRINAAVAELRSPPAGARLLEANRRATDLLLRGTTVAGLDGWDGGRDRAIDYIDWDDPSANDFLALSQFPVATPGRAPNIRPDVTLFVNGVPLVVIEAKPPGSDSGITDAIDQLRRYANQRGGETAEGAEQLFWTNQFTVATTGERAEAATFSALPEHYLAWKDPYPATIDEVAASLDKPAAAVTQQELLTAGMLTPERLLGHRPALHAVRGGRLGSHGQDRRPLPAVPRRPQGDAAAAHRRHPGDRRPRRPPGRDHLAHPGVGQEPDHGVPDPGDAEPPRVAAGSRSSWSPTAPTSSNSSATPPGSPARPSRLPGARPRCGSCCARTVRPW